MTSRYALYYAPDPASALWRFGSQVIGYDAAAGESFPPKAPGGEPDWPALTEEPRRYGFHATLKAPFELAAGESEASLIAAMESYAGSAAPVLLEGLEVSQIGAFCALTPLGDATAIDALASDIVRAFERFRAPLSEASRMRRLQAPLTPRQIEYLDRFGYPYVHEEFRFHMTLTGPLPARVCGRAGRVCEGLRRAYAEAVGTGPAAIDRITLFRQPRADASFAIAACALLKLRRD